MAVDAAAVKLTDYTTCGGCAAKYPAARLEELLVGLVPPDARDLLVGLAPSDDAAVYRLDDERALVATVDFFPPLVDDPADYGAIAAANALNDVFAMGGQPLLALSVAAFPEALPGEAVAAVLAPRPRQCASAGGVLAGGHTLRDDEPKFGLAVVGTVRPDEIWTKAGAQPDDLLFLTKPLGTGLIVHGDRAGSPAATLDGGNRLDAQAEPRTPPTRRAVRARTRSPTSPASACSATPTRPASGAAWRIVLEAARAAAAARRARGRRPRASAPAATRRNRDFAAARRSRPTPSPTIWSSARLRPADRRRLLVARRTRGRATGARVRVRRLRPAVRPHRRGSRTGAASG